MKEKIKCSLCSHESVYINNFSKHLERIHNVTLQEYYTRYGIVGVDYMVCPFCGVYKRNLTRHFNYYHKDEYKDYKIKYPNYVPYVSSYSNKMKNIANKRWIPPDPNYIITNLEEGKDLSLLISNPDCKLYGSEEMQKWVKDKVQSIIRSKKNLTNWKNKMYEYKGVNFRSIHEYNIAIELDKYRVSYLHEEKIFPYILNNKIHMEVTDFYIPDFNLIIEVKDSEFSNYIDYRPNTVEKLEAMGKFVRNTGYEYALIDNTTLLHNMLMRYSLINNEK